MYKLALIGRDIGYTQSPAVHQAIACVLGAELCFDVCDVAYDMLGDTVKKLTESHDGFFVTKPYKIDIKRYLDPEKVNDCAVNAVRSRDGAAFSTDGAGLILALDRNFSDWRENTSAVLLLGAGGAAHSAAKALKATGKRVYVFNRTLMHAVRMCTEVGAELYVNQPAELVVNCTPLGTGGEDVLRSLCVLPSFKYAFDMVYAQSSTPFLRRCGADGSQTAGGNDMLIYQAIEGDKLIFGLDFDAHDIYEQVIKRLERER